MLKRLINFSSHLDRIGLEKEADYLDGLIKKYSATAVDEVDVMALEGQLEEAKRERDAAAEPGAWVSADDLETISNRISQLETELAMAEESLRLSDEEIYDPDDMLGQREGQVAEGFGGTPPHRRTPPPNPGAWHEAPTHGMRTNQLLTELKRVQDHIETERHNLRKALNPGEMRKVRQLAQLARTSERGNRSGLQNEEVRNLLSLLTTVSGILVNTRDIDSSDANAAVDNLDSLIQVALRAARGVSGLTQADQPDQPALASRNNTLEKLASRNNTSEKLAHLWPEID